MNAPNATLFTTSMQRNENIRGFQKIKIKILPTTNLCSTYGSSYHVQVRLLQPHDFQSWDGCFCLHSRHWLSSCCRHVDDDTSTATPTRLT